MLTTYPHHLAQCPFLQLPVLAQLLRLSHFSRGPSPNFLPWSPEIRDNAYVPPLLMCSHLFRETLTLFAQEQREGHILNKDNLYFPSSS